MVILSSQQLAGSSMVAPAFHHGPWSSQYRSQESKDAGAALMGFLFLGFFAFVIIRAGHYRRERLEREERIKKHGYRGGRGPYLPTHYRHRHRRW